MTDKLAKAKAYLQQRGITPQLCRQRAAEEACPHCAVQWLKPYVERVIKAEEGRQ